MKLRLLALVTLVAISGAVLAQGPKASAEEMVAAIKAVKMPPLDQTKVNDKAYVAEYIKQRNDAMKQRAELIFDLYKSFPDNSEVPTLMPQRWSTFVMSYPPDKAALKSGLDETQMVLDNKPTPELAKSASFWWSNFKMMDVSGDSKQMLAAADSFISKYKDDPRGFSLLSQVADETKDKSGRVALYNRMLKDYPNQRGIKYIAGKIKQENGLGKPFELNFTDVFSGVKHSISDFKGKVVVIDFWATWCGPCVAELPKMKQLYADYHDKGLEIISVSLDVARNDDPTKDGLAKLKSFVAKNDMPWFHYYQGNYWDSEYSTSWGINSIPALFLVDQNGNLVDVEAREGIEERVKALLEKK